MQYHDDDMDELFKRAAENYPLNTNTADWSKVQAMLHPEEKKRRGAWWWNKRTYLLLLLLVPFFICNRIMLKDNGIAKQSQAVTTEKEIINANEKAAMTEQSSDDNVAATIQITKDQSIRGQVKTSQQIQNADLTNNTAVYSFKKQVPKKNSSPAKQTNDLSENDIISKQSSTNNITTAQVNGQRSITDPVVAHIEKEEKQVNKTEETLEQKEINEAAAIEQPSKQKPATPKPKHFYIGLMGGPDISTVRFQKFGNVGFEAGVIVGYEFSKKFSVEAGVFTDKKYYKSDGEYLNTSKVYMPANSKITNVNGNCRMIELPLNLKYTIANKDKHTWFATAGVSSYLMSKEAYDYDYLYLWNNRTVTYSKEYNDATKNWFSVGQISVGYTRQLGNNGSLRIEPYYKLPLKGLGYGELPISSLGIHIGVTTKLF